MKKFKAKKKKKLNSLLIVILILLVCYLTINILCKIKIENQDLISSLLNDSNHYIANNSIIDGIIDFFNSFKTTDLLDYSVETNETSSDSKYDSNLTNYIEDPNPIDIKNPKVYIYNTHQLEGYEGTNSIEYNITPNVQMASYLLKDKLNNYNIPTIVENGNISDLLSLNGWSYSYSYKASRYYLEETLKKYKDLDLIIDLHRDSIPHDSSTIEFDNKKYAKVLFVIGKDYETYEKNLSLAVSLNNLIKEQADISRGVIVKGGNDVNGIYNQDLNKNIVLIEVGGNENTLDEVINTINVIATAIKNYLKGD